MNSAPLVARPILWQGAHLKSIIIQGSGTSQRDNYFYTKFSLIINTSGHGNPKEGHNSFKEKEIHAKILFPGPDMCSAFSSCLHIRECCKNNGIEALLSSRHSLWLSGPAAQISLELLCELNFPSCVDDLTYMRLPKLRSRNAGYCLGIRAPEKR